MINKPVSLIVFFTAMLVAAVPAAILLLLPDQVSILNVTLIFIITGILSCLAITVLINRYFFLHVRTIYKNVALLNAATSHKVVDEIPNRELIPAINKILFDWEKGNKEEIIHLKELEEFRKEFLGNVSHELKTPIFSIQGYVHTLLDGGIEDQDINILYLQKASRSIDRLINIVDDLESISKLEAGELILEHRTFDVHELIRDVIDSLELKARAKKIAFTFHEEFSRIYVYADKERIRQVMVNLIENSIKYGKEGGNTIISTTVGTNHISIRITDDSIGIGKIHLPRLFERFYRVDKSRSRDQGGTGLGLAIVKHIIEAHQQKITVESIPGEGTTFAFTLPLSNT